MMNKQRIDLYLVKHNYCETRNQAKQMLEFGLIKVDGQLVTKSNYLIDDNSYVEVEKLAYVSRAGYKLAKALEVFKIDLNNKVVLDIGASTGGFTDCALQHKAKLVYALDVGTDQLAPSLRNNSQVITMENINLKSIPEIEFKEKIDIIVCDVSFISLKHVFKSLTNLYNESLEMVFLIKPQYELDSKTIAKNNGVIKNHLLHEKAINNVKSYAQDYSVKLLNLVSSPIKGSKGGNEEFLGYFKWIK